MTFNNILRSVMKDTKTTMVMLGERVGVKQTAITMSLQRDIRISSAVKYLNAMGYDLVVVQRKSGRKPDGSFVVTVEEESVPEQGN